MKGLGREVHAALEIAKRANAAPAFIRRRGRERLAGALAAGAVTTSAVLAQGAGQVLSSAAAGGTWSMAGTMVVSTLVGLSSGLLAISATDRVERPRQATMTATTVSTRAVARGPSQAVESRREPRPNASTALAASVQMPGESLERTAAPLLVASPPKRSMDATPSPATPSPEPPVLATSGLVATESAPKKASIAAELELLRRVRRDLLNGQPALAIATLDRYSEEFRAGALHEEAAASRVVALCALGRLDEGRRQSIRFRSRYPDSPQLKRVESACSSVP